jgi:hypothetical protein
MGNSLKEQYLLEAGTEGISLSGQGGGLFSQENSSIWVARGAKTSRGGL